METKPGKTALITGATSGIGRELANLFAKDGYDLVLVARHDNSLHQVAEGYHHQFGVNTTVIAKDLSDPKAPQEIYDETRQRGITINVLVNNAGMGEYGMFATQTDIDKELSIIQLNAVSLVHLTKLYLKDMVDRNEGKILMLASVASTMPNPLMAVYGATKAFILSFTEAIRNELKDTDVSVTALMPGATNTDFFNKAGAANAKVTDSLADPAGVAKDGYTALMKGKDKVVSGLMNKVQVAMTNILPDPALASTMRKSMEDKQEAAQQDKQLAKIAFGVGLAAVAIAGIFLASSYANANAYEREQYRNKAKRATDKAKDTLASLKDQLVSSLSMN